MKLKGAIIGVSGYGNVHYTDLMRCCKEGLMEFVGATVINRDVEQEKCAALESMGCKIYDDYKVMLDELSGKIDFCTIPTGILHHKDMTIYALQKHINVLVEKPAAPDMESINAMKQAEKESGSFACVGFQYNYHKTTHDLKALLLSGELGAVKRLKGYCLWPRNNQYYSRNGWSGKLFSNGLPVFDAPFSNATAHYLMLLLYFGGSVQDKGAMPVKVEGGLWRANPDIESCDTAELHYTLDNGLMLDYYCSHSCDKDEGPFLRIVCEKGEVTWTLSKITVKTESSEREIPVITDPFGSRAEMWHALFDRASGKQSFITELDLAACHTKAVDLAFKSLSIEKPESVQIINEENKTFRYLIPGFSKKAIEQVKK